MALTKFTGAINTIQSLPTRPNQDGGLTDAQLKLKFDQHAIDNETYLNDVLTVEIEAQFPKNTDVLRKNNTTPFTPTDLYHPATMKYVNDSVAGVVLGQVSDGSITPQKLSFDPATQAELDVVGNQLTTLDSLYKNQNKVLSMGGIF